MYFLLNFKIHERIFIKQRINVLEGFGCVFLYCVTGTGYKIIFGTGTNLIIGTSKFFNASGVLRHIFISIHCVL